MFGLCASVRWAGVLVLVLRGRSYGCALVLGRLRRAAVEERWKISLLLAVLLMERELARVSIIITITPYSTPPITPSLPSTRHHRELYKSPEAYCEGRIL